MSSPPKPDAPPPPVRRSPPIRITGNVHPMFGKLAEIKLSADSDLVWTTQNYHDFHNIPDLQVSSLKKAVFMR